MWESLQIPTICVSSCGYLPYFDEGPKSRNEAWRMSLTLQNGLFCGLHNGTHCGTSLWSHPLRMQRQEDLKFKTCSVKANPLWKRKTNKQTKGQGAYSSSGRMLDLWLEPCLQLVNRLELLLLPPQQMSCIDFFKCVIQSSLIGSSLIGSLHLLA
jgi:hypothetical protein